MLKKIGLNFSWKQKLTTFICITLVGLVLITGAGLVGFNHLHVSAEKKNNAAEYKQMSLRFDNQLLVIELSAGDISKDNVGGFMSNVVSLLNNAHAMVEKAENLGHEDLKDMARNIGFLAESYHGFREEWLENRDLLGFTASDNKIAEIVEAEQNLSKIAFSRIKGLISTISTAQKAYLINGSAEEEQKIYRSVVELNAMSERLKWGDNIIGTSISNYETAFLTVRELMQKESQILENMQPVFAELSQLTKQQNEFLDAVVIEQVKMEASQAKETAANIMLISAAVMGFIILVSIGGMTHQLTSQLGHMQIFLKRVAEGDFTQSLVIGNNQKDEFTQLKSASNMMVDDISRVLSEVVNGNYELLNIREELQQAVDQLMLSSREVEQKTQQSTVATQQISIAVDDVAERSADVGKATQSASDSTKTGSKVICDCVDAMVHIVDLIGDSHAEVENLSQSSSKMLGIIDVINGLADQTNLLALNAAIESARAGEAGRGFSVVADEVRALAQKTVGATGSIGEIIKEFNDQSKRMRELMEQGIKLASSGQDKANNAMASIELIETSVRKAASEMDQVVASVEEISCNTNEIAMQIEEICKQSESTNETRLILEGHTSKLSSQAELLGDLTGRFKLSEHE